MATGPAYTADNVIVGQAALHYRPYDPTVLIETLIPSKSKALWAPWESPWIPVGATEEGVTLQFSRDTQQITIEEQSAPVLETTNSTEFNVNTTLSEDVLTTWALSLGGGTITSTAASGTGATAIPAFDELVISEDMQPLTIGFEAKNKWGKPRFVIIPKVVSVADAEIAFRRADDARRVEVSLKSLCRSDSVKIIEVKS